MPPLDEKRTSSGVRRRRWIIRGQVQGVGFRPFVYKIAHETGVTGSVLNDSQGVTLEIQGELAALEAFGRAFDRELPPLARVDHREEHELRPCEGERGFVIRESSAGETPSAAVTPDVATCPDCLRELFSPGDRRYGHELINCTNCGPRYSIIREIPYDRVNTTMAKFAMCPDCAREYAAASDRRFHAQPVCCPRCGPRAEFMEVRRTGAGFAVAKSSGPPTGTPCAMAAEKLWQGYIVAIKGIGGFHLAVRADKSESVRRMRALKRRDTKPLALMVQNLAMARRYVTLSAGGERELTSIRAPIVLAPRVAKAPVTKEVAPGTEYLGIMLPYTPIQHLIWGELEKLSSAAGEMLPALIMTSGNATDEPLAIDNEEAVERLGPLCDAFLLHERPIERCVDDSVLLDRGEGEGPLPMRRSRGFVPVPRELPGPGNSSSMLCVGGELKNVVAVVQNRQVVLSQHLGDLTHALAYENFRKTVDDLLRLFGVKQAETIVHDLHPSYLSTGFARELAERTGATLVGVQHHHAHAAAVLAEHHIADPAMAIVCDGTGFGTDGTIWGGELMWVDGPRYQRLARLKPMVLPGGDAAAKDTRRSALSLLQRAYGEGFAEMPAAKAIMPEESERRMIAAMISRRVNSPLTSSTGRVFDGVAALLGLCLFNGHEAQAPMTLEAAARGATAMEDHDLFVVSRTEEAFWEIDLSPMIRWLVEKREDGLPAGTMSATFHAQLAKAFISAAKMAAEAMKNGTEVLIDGRAETVVVSKNGRELAAKKYAKRGEYTAGMAAAPLGFSGGVFCNQLLSAWAGAEAKRAGFQPVFHRDYPPNDGGLAFGQAVVGASI